MKILDLHNITKIFGEGYTAIKAIDNIDLEVKKGEILLVMGPSGSGKTTLLSIAGGILKPTEGKVILKDIEITILDEEKLPKVRMEKVGFVFQAFNLLSALSAVENVEVALNLAGVQGEEAKEKAQKILSQFGLEKRMNDVPANLSGGEKQRVAIARALVNDPDIILADEPTANLDSKMGHEVMKIFRQIAKDEQKSVVIVSHDQRLKDIADRILWLEDGKFKQLSKMETDPVCGMRIEKGKFKTIYKEKEYFFCSSGCRTEFIKSPQKVLRGDII